MTEWKPEDLPEAAIWSPGRRTAACARETLPRLLSEEDDEPAVECDGGASAASTRRARPLTFSSIPLYVESVRASTDGLLHRHEVIRSASPR